MPPANGKRSVRAEIRMKDKKARTIKDAPAKPEHLPHIENISHKQVWPRSFALTHIFDQKPFFFILFAHLLGYQLSISIQFWAYTTTKKQHRISTSTKSHANNSGIYCGAFRLFWFISWLQRAACIYHVHRTPHQIQVE